MASLLQEPWGKASIRQTLLLAVSCLVLRAARYDLLSESFVNVIDPNFATPYFIMALAMVR